ncbi:hypothetical protein GCM10027262_74760 [Nocardia tengchongensis]
MPAESHGYGGQQITRADTVLLSCPFSCAAQGYSPADALRYHLDGTDPCGPNMSNSVAASLTAQPDPRPHPVLPESIGGTGHARAVPFPDRDCQPKKPTTMSWFNP